MITAETYYRVIAKPTVEEFFQKNDDLRLGMLGCMATLHVIDYVYQNRVRDPKAAEREAARFKETARGEHFFFEVIEGFALARSTAIFNPGRGSTPEDT
jgi:hypothetical protein